MNEDLIFYEKEPNYRERRQVQQETTEEGSGGPIYFNSTIFITTTTKVFNPCDSSPCESNSTCHVQGNNYTCDCDDGFVYNDQQNSCQDIDECAQNISNCKQNETCVNTLGSYKCVCKDGFESINNTCVEISSTTSTTTTDFTTTQTISESSSTLESSSSSSLSTTTNSDSSSTSELKSVFTSETTTNTISESTTTLSTTTTTIYIGSLISGNLDTSIKSQFVNGIYDYQTGYSDLNIMGSNFNAFKVIQI